MKFKKTSLRLLLLGTVLANLLLAQLNFAYAQQPNTSATPTYSGVESTIKEYLCTPGNRGDDLYTCINQIYKIALVVSSSIGVLYIIIAGYVYMSSDGNKQSVDKAKDMIVTTITALVILFGGYVLLHTLNPDLTQFNPIQPPEVTLPTSQVPGYGQTPSGTLEAMNAAVTLVSYNGNKIDINSGNCDCSGNCPLNTLQTLAGGGQATYDGPGSTCNAGSTTVSATMLNTLISIANAGNKYTITSLTGGHHSSASDPHYQGRAVDVVPSPSNAQNQTTIVQALRSGGATKIGLECGGSYYALTGSNDGDSRCIGQSGYHIHAQW